MLLCWRALDLVTSFVILASAESSGVPFILIFALSIFVVLVVGQNISIFERFVYKSFLYRGIRGRFVAFACKRNFILSYL